MTNAPVLSLLDCNQVFEVECDASNMGIGMILSQDGRLNVFFSVKLSDSREEVFCL